MPKSTLLSTGMQMLTGAVALFIVSVFKGEFNGFSFGHVSIAFLVGVDLSDHIWVTGRVCILWMVTA